MKLFRTYDALRIFAVAGEKLSFTQTADNLSLTKGAISYQIKRLEEELGFKLFSRQNGRVELTTKGKKLWQSAHKNFTELETEITQLKQLKEQRITIGMSTYFASRWLMPRLMDFTSAYPNIGLRLQPTIDLIDFESANIDMAIRWGDGHWKDMHIKQLFNCPAIATAGRITAKQIEQNNLQASLSQIPLLHDREGSHAWKDWHQRAGLDYQKRHNELVIPDPNVRVQAVINSQGLALNDSLVKDEIADGRLIQVTPVVLDDYGYYLAYPERALSSPALSTFHDWIISEASE